MGRTKTVRSNPFSGRPPAARRRPGTEPDRTRSRSNRAGEKEMPGLRERKKARLRQEIIDTAGGRVPHGGAKKTPLDDIAQSAANSQPALFLPFLHKTAPFVATGWR